jgi:hypothetical protein
MCMWGMQNNQPELADQLASAISKNTFQSRLINVYVWVETRTCSRITFSNSRGPRWPFALQRVPFLVMAMKSESETKMRGEKFCKQTLKVSVGPLPPAPSGPDDSKTELSEGRLRHLKTSGLWPRAHCTAQNNRAGNMKVGF